MLTRPCREQGIPGCRIASTASGVSRQRDKYHRQPAWLDSRESGPLYRFDFGEVPELRIGFSQDSHAGEIADIAVEVAT